MVFAINFGCPRWDFKIVVWGGIIYNYSSMLLEQKWHLDILTDLFKCLLTIFEQNSENILQTTICRIRIKLKIYVIFRYHWWYLQRVLALCEFRYCGFSKPLLKICLMRFLCTINFVNAVIFLMRFLANATFFQVPKVA